MNKFTLLMSERGILENTDAPKFGIRPANNLFRYPEHQANRRQQIEFVEYLIEQGFFPNLVIMTDSDYIFNQFRIAIKEGRVHPQSVTVMVENLNGEIETTRIDKDGRFFDDVPDIFNYNRDQLIRLL